MAVPYIFGTATSAIPLSQLDTNFATPITIGNTTVALSGTITTLNNMTLANVTISSGNVTITNVAVTTANVTTANIANSIITTGETLSYGTANGVAYLSTNKVVTTGSVLTFDGAQLGVNGITVGRGAGAVSTNTAVGASALAANTSGSNNTAVGYQAGYTNTGNGGCVFVGKGAGYYATGGNNTIVGADTTGSASFSGTYNTLMGYGTGNSLTTGTNNTFIGTLGSSNYCGASVTQGSKNTIIGGYSGNQGGLDIRTASNYIVLSDGDGVPRMYASNANDGAIYSPSGAFSSARNVTVSALNTAYILYNYAFSGILTLRDNTTGGSDIWLCDPNGGFTKIAGNISVATTVYYSGGNTYIQQTSGAVSRNFSYAGVGNS